MSTYTIDDFYDVKNLIKDKLGDINYFSDEVRLFFEKMSSMGTNTFIKKKKP